MNILKFFRDKLLRMYNDRDDDFLLEPVQSNYSEGPSKSAVDYERDLTDDIYRSIDLFENIFIASKNQDFRKLIVDLPISFGEQAAAHILYMKGLCDEYLLTDLIMKPLGRYRSEQPQLCLPVGQRLSHFHHYIVASPYTKISHSSEETRRHLLRGYFACFIPGEAGCLLIEGSHVEQRQVNKPETEMTLRGSQEGFSESLAVNVSMIRKYIRSERLVADYVDYPDSVHNSKIAIMYIEQLCDPQLLDRVKGRVANIDTDLLIGGGALQQFIEDRSYSLIPTLTTTERPDRAVGALLDGQIVLISDNSPFAVLAPSTFWTLFHTSEEFFLRTFYANFIRSVRLLACFFSLFSPGIYIALTNYQPEMIPSDLLLHIAGSREMLPFPTILEVLMMEISIELIREAGIRLPRTMGATIGIVGALILGQAAVEANLISPALVILVSITALGNFAIPNQDLASALRIGRFMFLFLGSVLGFYGIAWGIVAMLGYIVTIESFGVPYLSPLYPAYPADKDTVWRSQLWKQVKYEQQFHPMQKRQTKGSVRKWK